MIGPECDGDDSCLSRWAVTKDTLGCLKWSGKTGHPARVYPTLKNGHAMMKMPVFGQFRNHSGACGATWRQDGAGNRGQIQKCQPARNLGQMHFG